MFKISTTLEVRPFFSVDGAAVVVVVTGKLFPIKAGHVSS